MKQNFCVQAWSQHFGINEQVFFYISITLVAIVMNICAGASKVRCSCIVKTVSSLSDLSHYQLQKTCQVWLLCGWIKLSLMWYFNSSLKYIRPTWQPQNFRETCLQQRCSRGSSTHDTRTLHFTTKPLTMCSYFFQTQ